MCVCVCCAVRQFAVDADGKQRKENGRKKTLRTERKKENITLMKESLIEML